jgi:hypothetical protein
MLVLFRSYHEAHEVKNLKVFMLILMHLRVLRGEYDNLIDQEMTLVRNGLGRLI